jgi:predicted HicB family RNase H-like nuclease
MIDAKSYNITVRKDWFDGELCFEARIAELPDIAEYADSFEEAYLLAIDAIETTAQIFTEQDKAMPQPMNSTDDDADKIILSLSKTLHRSLRDAAGKKGESLNQYLISMLGHYAESSQSAHLNEKNSVSLHP